MGTEKLDRVNEAIAPKEDVVEYALTYGIKITGKRFHLNETIVRHYLWEFLISVSTECGCVTDLRNVILGGPCLEECFCMRYNVSKSLQERLRKAGFTKAF